MRHGIVENAGLAMDEDILLVGPELDAKGAAIRVVNVIKRLAPVGGALLDVDTEVEELLAKGGKVGIGGAAHEDACGLDKGIDADVVAEAAKRVGRRAVANGGKVSRKNVEGVAEGLDGLVLELGLGLRGQDLLDGPVRVLVGSLDEAGEGGSLQGLRVKAVPLKGKGAILGEGKGGLEGQGWARGLGHELNPAEILDILDKHLEARAEVAGQTVVVGAQSVKDNAGARAVEDGGHDERGKHLHDAVDERLDSDDGDAEEHLHVPVQKGGEEGLVEGEKVAELVEDRGVVKVGEGKAHGAPHELLVADPTHAGFDARVEGHVVKVPGAVGEETNLGGGEHLRGGQLLEPLVGNEVDVHTIHHGHVAHRTKELENVPRARHNVILGLVKALDAIDKDEILGLGLGLVQESGKGPRGGAREVEGVVGLGVEVGEHCWQTSATTCFYAQSKKKIKTLFPKIAWLEIARSLGLWRAFKWHTGKPPYDEPGAVPRAVDGRL